MTAAVSVASLEFIAKQLALHKVESIHMLPPHARKEIKKEARAIATRDVFGVGFKTDKAGNPVEMGLGSPSNMTQQHIDAYIKAQTDPKMRPGGPEPAYEDHLSRMRKQLAECIARRPADLDDDDED